MSHSETGLRLFKESACRILFFFSFKKTKPVSLTNTDIYERLAHLWRPQRPFCWTKKSAMKGNFRCDQIHDNHWHDFGHTFLFNWVVQQTHLGLVLLYVSFTKGGNRKDFICFVAPKAVEESAESAVAVTSSSTKNIHHFDKIWEQLWQNCRNIMKQLA